MHRATPARLSVLTAVGVGMLFTVGRESGSETVMDDWRALRQIPFHVHRIDLFPKMFLPFTDFPALLSERELTQA
jgi:hypothetical protein